MLPAQHAASANLRRQPVPPLRQHRRVALKVEVTLQSESNFYNGFSVNISEGGLFVATHDYKPIGTRLTLDMNIPDGRGPISVSCEVRWVREYNEMVPDMVPGMGVRFLNLSDEVAGRIEEFIEDMRDPLFFDDEDL